jgi:hypothetical protein
MARKPNDIYCFIYDEQGRFYTANQLANGTWNIPVPNAIPYPIKFAPPNFKGNPIEFATNNRYFAPVRTLGENVRFIKDGAAILRSLYFLGKGFEQKMYIRIISWDGSQIPGRYKLAYVGRIDFSEKVDDPEINDFVCPVVDDTTWALLSQKDGVQYSLQCNSSNPKAIRTVITGTTLLNNLTFQTVNAAVRRTTTGVYHVAPFALVNQDGDSAGVISKTQQSYNIPSTTTLADYTATALTGCVGTIYPINNVTIEGSVKFTWTTDRPDGQSGGLRIFFRTSTGQEFNVFSQLGGGLIPGNIYNFGFSFTLNLAANENIFYINQLSASGGDNFSITPIVTNTKISTKTTSQTVVCWGLRPLDALQDIVDQATEGKGTIDSNLLRVNNKDILTSGNAIRGFDNAVITTSFEDFFQTFDCIHYAAMRTINGSLWFEKATEVYKQNGNLLFDLGEAIKCKLKPAKEFFCNSVKVGSPIVDYRHPSGRLEVNSTNLFSLPILNSDKEMDLVTRYRTGCYDIIFLILDYQGGSTKDNSGDNATYLLAITDEQESATDTVETFIELTINNASLNPIIKSPATGDRINYNKPIIRGIAQPGQTVNIYADGLLDGSAVTGVDGKWSHEIVNALSSYASGIATGEHTIQATFTDLVAPFDSVTVVIDTTEVTQTILSYPNNGDGLYNNKPLIRGYAQRGTNINIFIDGILRASVVADSSCRWEWKADLLANGTRTITVGTQSAIVEVNSFTEFPLVTYAGSELDGFLIMNNLPLIQGVAKPGTSVSLFLDYITYSSLGTAIADANGNWSFQVVPVTYPDPLGGGDVNLAPISNGLHIVSTSLVNRTVNVGVFGYKLDRPAYAPITGVTDNTVFNTRYSPKRLLLARKPLFASILNQQPLSEIKFQDADKNGNQVTTLGGVTISERANEQRSSLGNPLLLLEYADIETRVPLEFDEILSNFSNGGEIHFKFRGTSIYALPIGSMKQASITNKVQEWSLLISPRTSYLSLLNLYKNGVTINLNIGQMYHSDYNTLHIVTYDYNLDPKYSNADLWEDLFNNRNNGWVTNPKQFQMLSKFDGRITDQIITSGTAQPFLRIYSVKNASPTDPDVGIVQTIAYNPVVPQPVFGREIVMEAHLELTGSGTIAAGEYFAAIFVDDLPVGISEKIIIKERWKDTIFIEAKSDINETGFFFSTGVICKYRVQGLVKKYLPKTNAVTSVDDIGNSSTQYQLMMKRRTIRAGTGAGLPDYQYLKVSSYMLLPDFKCEGVRYTPEDEAEVTASEDVPGYPMYHVSIPVLPYDNKRGQTFTAVTGEDAFEGTILIVEPEAVGLPPGALETIVLDRE